MEEIERQQSSLGNNEDSDDNLLCDRESTCTGGSAKLYNYEQQTTLNNNKHLSTIDFLSQDLLSEISKTTNRKERGLLVRASQNKITELVDSYCESLIEDDIGSHSDDDFCLNSERLHTNFAQAQRVDKSILSINKNQELIQKSQYKQVGQLYDSVRSLLQFSENLNLNLLKLKKSDFIEEKNFNFFAKNQGFKERSKQDRRLIDKHIHSYEEDSQGSYEDCEERADEFIPNQGSCYRFDEENTQSFGVISKNLTFNRRGSDFTIVNTQDCTNTSDYVNLGFSLTSAPTFSLQQKLIRENQQKIKTTDKLYFSENLTPYSYNNDNEEITEALSQFNKDSNEYDNNTDQMLDDPKNETVMKQRSLTFPKIFGFGNQQEPVGKSHPNLFKNETSDAKSGTEMVKHHSLSATCVSFRSQVYDSRGYDNN